MKQINIDSNLLLAYSELIKDDFFEMSVLANTSAFLNEILDNISWVGFYILKGDTLYLGPFQGKVACTTIEVGKGVCGTAVARREAIVVPDVEKFPGHIYCDPLSQSEIVIPIFLNNEVYGVLDIDSPIKNRFTDADKDILQEFINVLENHLKSVLKYQNEQD